MDISFDINDICIAVTYKDGKTNVYDKLIDSKYLDNKDELIKIFNKISKRQNYFPKKIQAIKAIIFVEE